MNPRAARDAAVQAVIRAAKMRFGTIDINVWDGRATDSRTRHTQVPDSDPIAFPSRVELVEHTDVQRAAQTLSRLYNRPRATFSILVQAGKYTQLQVHDGEGPPAR